MAVLLLQRAQCTSDALHHGLDNTKLEPARRTRPSAPPKTAPIPVALQHIAQAVGKLIFQRGVRFNPPPLANLNGPNNTMERSPIFKQRGRTCEGVNDLTRRAGIHGKQVVWVVQPCREATKTEVVIGTVGAVIARHCRDELVALVWLAG